MSAVTRHLSVDPYARDYGNNLTDDFGSIPVVTAAEIRAARLTVAAHAESVDECAELLAMLGLA